MALGIYADDHDGWLPHGGTTPEHSLSFLCTNNDEYAVKGLLRGKHLSQSVVDEALARDGSLSPASCGWHYVEGLRADDPPDVAIAWDKVTGLGHNGQRVRWLAREVVMLDGSSQLIGIKNWAAFVALQKNRLTEIQATRSPNAPPIRWSDEATLGPNTASAR